MPSTYTPIASTTISSAVTVITFSSIPSTYTDLVLVSNATVTGSPRDLLARFNSDSGTNYSATFFDQTGNTPAGGQSTNATYVPLDNYGYIEPTQGQMAISHFMNYSNTTTYKNVLSRSNNAANGLSLIIGSWRSTSAINRIDLYAGTANASMPSGTFTLYGIKAA